ncbi:MAG: sensor domain-containing diguanylate cyclase [Sphaerochaetaceae bacterium]
MKQVYRGISIFLILLSSALIILFYTMSTQTIKQSFLEDTQNIIYESKANFIKSTVDNLINTIESRREFELSKYHDAIEGMNLLIEQAYHEKTTQEFLEVCDTLFSQRVVGGNWDMFLWNVIDQEILFDSTKSHQNVSDIFSYIHHETATYAMFEDYLLGPYHLFYAVNNSAIDDVVKGVFEKDIHNLQFSDDQYIWVNEVINYQGGDDYAIRRIHPNLIDTEGMLLSTSMTDIEGNFPYLEELEGINNYGEIFFTYYFERLNSDEISKKLSYAKLYSPFNWIVAMGVPLERIDQLSEQANRRADQFFSQKMPLFVIVLGSIVVLSFVLFLIVERLRTKKDRQSLEIQALIDPLTGMFNRRRGMNDLTDDFMLFIQTGRPSHALLILDFDNFKEINDTLGHLAGDRALQTLTKTIQQNIRISDRIYRWGGDEFVIIGERVHKDAIGLFADKVMRAAASIGEECECGTFTVSIGATCFLDSDSSHYDSLERADKALYEAKRMGKNRVVITLDEK